MVRNIALIALLGIGIPSLAAASEVLSNQAPDPSLTTDLADWGVYIQGYGGVVVQGPINVTDSFDFGPGDTLIEHFVDQLSAGATFGIGAGATTPIDGLSVGVDVMHTRQNVTSLDGTPFVPDAQYDSLSVFGTVEGAYHLSPTFDLYATGGLGATTVHIHNPDTFIDQPEADSTWAPAYEVAVGLRARVTNHLSLFTEAKHADVFSAGAFPPTEGGELTESVSFARNAVVAGVRLNF